MKFAHPHLLWLIPAALALLGLLFWWGWRSKARLMEQFVPARLRAQLASGFSAPRRLLRAGLIAGAVAAAMLAVARPQWGYDWQETRQRGLDVVVAIDTSRSMLAPDLAPNRLERAKLAALDLRRLAGGDRIGLVAFAGGAFLQCPLTHDEESFRESVDALEAGVIPQGGTALSEAIRTATEAFSAKSGDHKAIVLFTDGEDHEGEAVEAAKSAAKAGIKIFTVGVGTPSGELIRITDERGAAGFLKDEQGNPVKSRLNEALLRQIAAASGGFHQPLRGTASMESLHARGLEPLPKSEAGSKLLRQPHERFQWALSLAIALLAFEVLLPDRTGRQAANGPGTRAATAAGALLLLTLPCTAAASPEGAQRRFAAGDFAAAREEYSRLLEKSPDDARLHFNAGAAAYRAGEFDEASRHFESAQLTPDLALQQRAHHNLGNSLFRIGEAEAAPDERLVRLEEAARQFGAALKLDGTDADARHNLELVRKRIEELRRQQNQSQQKPDRSSQQQGQPPPPTQGKEQQKGKGRSGQPQQGEQGKPQEGQRPEAGRDGKPEDQGGGREKEPQKDGKSGDSPRNGDGNTESGDNPAAGGATAKGVLTPPQARQLLDAQKGEERPLLLRPAGTGKENNRFFKDW